MAPISRKTHYLFEEKKLILERYLSSEQYKVSLGEFAKVCGVKYTTVITWWMIRSHYTSPVPSIRRVSVPLQCWLLIFMFRTFAHFSRRRGRRRYIRPSSFPPKLRLFLQRSLRWCDRKLARKTLCQNGRFVTDEALPTAPRAIKVKTQVSP